MTQNTYPVKGMTCGGCIRKVKTAISGVAGVTDVQIDFKSRSAIVTSDSDLDGAAIKAAVEGAGYEVAT